MNQSAASQPSRKKTVFSLLILLPPLPAWFQLVCKLLAAALSVTMAFGLHRESFFRQWGCFFLCNFLLAGAILGIGSLTQKGFATWGNSCCYLDFSLFQLILFTAAAYSLLHLCTLLRGRKRHTDSRFQVFLRLGERRLMLDGLADTGNNLTDTFSGTPVIVCSAAALEPLLAHSVKSTGTTVPQKGSSVPTGRGLYPQPLHGEKPQRTRHGRHCRHAAKCHFSPYAHGMKGDFFYGHRFSEVPETALPFAGTAVRSLPHRLHQRL